MRIPRATNASAPKTAFTIISWDERSLIGILHNALVVLTAERVSFSVQVPATHAWMAVLRGAEAQMQAVSVGEHIDWLERAVEKHVAWRLLGGVSDRVGGQR
jgi:hypothetical protein